MSWTLIESQTLVSSAASVTLGNGGTIPQTYKALRVVISARGDNGGTFVYGTVQINGNNNGFTYRELRGTGSTVSSVSGSNGYNFGASGSTATASTFGSLVVDFPNYAGSTNKPYTVDWISETNGTTAIQSLVAGLWSNTSAITSLTFTLDGASYATYSTLTLYGLK